MQLAPGSIVRPVVSVAGLEATQQYRVLSIEATPFYALAFVETLGGMLMPPIENAHLVLELVRGSTLKPAAAAMN